MNFEINKWLLIFTVSILLICIFYCNLLNIENMGSVPQTAPQIIDKLNTVRKLNDYVTDKTQKDKKIINLKCIVGDKTFYLGNVDKKKLDEKCSTSNSHEKILVLCDSSLTVKKNCSEEVLTKCYNNNEIADCQTFAKKKCNNDKLNPADFEYMIDKLISDKIDGKDNENVENPNYLLLLNDQKGQKIVFHY